MEPSVIIASVSLIGMVVTAFVTHTQNKRTNKLNEQTLQLGLQKADSEAFELARRMYSNTLKDIEAQLRRLREENAELIRHAGELQDHNARLQKRLTELEGLVVRMRVMMASSGLKMPDLLNEEGDFNGWTEAP